MFKIHQLSSPVVNVVLGQKATLDLNPGPRYHGVTLVATVTKTGLTAGNVFQPSLGDALGEIDILVNTVAKRQHLAVELDAIQTRWDASLAVKVYDQLGNDLLTAVPDVVVDTNTTRTTTFVFTIHFSEPTRDQYAAREAFAWPTLWASGRRIALQLQINVPANAGVANPVLRAIEDIDYRLGLVSNGKDVMPVTHWYRQPETYAGLALTLRKWPFAGVVQQMSLLSPPGSEDYIATYEIKGDGVTKFKGAKADLDVMQNCYGWNPAGVLPGQTDLAFDYSDDPTDALDMTQFQVFEAALTLTAAAAGNKTLMIVSQVYRDALA